MIEGVKTGHKCPECGNCLEYDVIAGTETLGEGAYSDSILVNIYCENADCEYYDWRYIDPISKEIE